MFAKRGRYPCAFERVFRDTYPSVYRFIKWTNRRDHAQLIRDLQRAEAALVVESVCPRLVDKVPVVSLHDAIYSRPQDIGLVLDAFEETFEAVGFRLVVKAEVPVESPSTHLHTAA